MDEFSKMFQTLQNSRNSDNNWIYVNPVTGKTHEGIGQGPLPWGQYPENMDEDSEEAQNYDMYRADIRPLPSELFKPGGLEEIQNLEEGSQLEDPMLMKASRTLHKYLEAPGRKETGPMRLAPPSKREMDFDEYAAWGVKFINAFENNTVAMAVNTARLMDAPPEVSQAMYYLLETGDRSGILGSNIGRAALNMATDPLMWVGLGTLGIGTAGKFAGQKMSKMAFKEILRKNILSKTTAVVGTEGALYGAAYDLARQNVGVSADAQDGFNLRQTALSTAIGGGSGALLAGVGPGAVEAARRGLVSLGEGASSRMADGGSQLNTGIDVDPLLAKVGELLSDEDYNRNKKTGQYIGGPKGLNTEEKLADLRVKAKNLALEGEKGKFWYERSGKAILDAVGGDVDEADKIIQAIAVTSPSTPVKANFDYAIQAYSAYKLGKPIKTGRFPTAMSARLEKIFAGEEWVGRKTDDFYNNLMVHIDPSRTGPVTGDLWMMRAFGFQGDMPSQKQYEFVTKETQRLASELGWEPHQVQAAIWVAQKAKTEGKDVLAASYDYSTALSESLAQISWESIPGRTSSHMPEIFDAPYEVKSAYHVDISKAFLDENGTDILAKELGLVSPGDFEAPGYFEGLVSPGTQTVVSAPRQYKGPKYGEVDSSTVELINAYATARGILMKQDGVGWHRPFYNPTKKDANGIELRIDRQFSETETAKLADILKELSGHGEYNPIATENGVRILNFDYLEFDNKEFAQLVKKAYDILELDDNSKIDPVLFNSQNGYVANDWSVSKNGEEYTNALRGTERPDIHGKVYDIIKKLQARIDDVDAEYSAKYGITRNTEINSQFRDADGSGVITDAPVERGADGN